jgi:hypothetical protein
MPYLVKKIVYHEPIMPRTQRMIIEDQSPVYHVMSRTALDGFPLGDIEKDYMLDLIRR